MSYSEENGQVVLRMSREDYEQLILMLGAVASSRCFGDYISGFQVVTEFVDRLNEGNSNWRPYTTTDKASAPPDSLPPRPAK